MFPVGFARCYRPSHGASWGEEADAGGARASRLPAPSRWTTRGDRSAHASPWSLQDLFPIPDDPGRPWAMPAVEPPSPVVGPTRTSLTRRFRGGFHTLPDEGVEEVGGGASEPRISGGWPAHSGEGWQKSVLMDSLVVKVAAREVQCDWAPADTRARPIQKPRSVEQQGR